MVTALEQIGGAAALDFANTREGDPEPEHLHGYDDVVAWAAHSGVIDTATARRLTSAARGGTADRAFERALRLRAAIDATFRALAAGREPAPGPLAELAAFEAEAIAHGRLVRVPNEGRGSVTASGDGSEAAIGPGPSPPAARFDWSWEGGDLDRVFWPVARSAVDLLRDGPLDRLKTCHVCPWLFLDLSRNRSRRWCSMNECGGRDKMRRYRARRATAGR
jgi:predicted RNA-binding Zn ribbon-like protein